MAKTKSVTERLDASRARTRERARETALLLALLTKQPRWGAPRSHLAEAADLRPDDVWRYVVCVHAGDGAMTWRMSDEWVAELFQHLRLSKCEHGAPTREEKIELLEGLVKA